MDGAVELPLEQPDLSFYASGDSLVRRSVLHSGFRVLSERVPGARSATIGFWVAVGSRDEHPADTGNPATFGSTHFLEHLLFKGTESRSALDIAVAFDSVGGEHNALTAKEHTCYYAKVQDRDLPMAIEILTDMFTSSVLDPSEFENERGVILEELAMAEDDPADVASERLFASVFSGHPLGRPIGGDPSTIGKATRDAVFQHYRANYRPQDLVVTVGGAVDHDELVAALNRALNKAGWDLTAAAGPVPRRIDTPGSISDGRPVTVVERPIEQVHLLLGMPGLIATDSRRPTMSVLNTVLGSGMSSRLFQEIRERRGLAYSVYSFPAAYSDAGIFGMYAACTPANATKVAELMRNELNRLADEPVTKTELERAVGQLGGRMALGLEDSDTRMSRLGRAELTLGEFQDFDESLRRINRVTPDDVQELAGMLCNSQLSLVAVGATTEVEFGAVVAANTVA